MHTKSSALWNWERNTERTGLESLLYSEDDTDASNQNNTIPKHFLHSTHKYQIHAEQWTSELQDKMWLRDPETQDNCIWRAI